MSKKKWQMTRAHYEVLVARWRSNYGDRMLDWPSYLRERYRSIEIITEVRWEPKQVRIPYGNTGVSEGVETQ